MSELGSLTELGASSLLHFYLKLLGLEVNVLMLASFYEYAMWPYCGHYPTLQRISLTIGLACELSRPISNSESCILSFHTTYGHLNKKWGMWTY